MNKLLLSFCLLASLFTVDAFARGSNQSCMAGRFGSQGVLKQVYSQNENSYNQACNKALNDCYREVGGNQYCRIIDGDTGVGGGNGHNRTCMIGRYGSQGILKEVFKQNENSYSRACEKARRACYQAVQGNQYCQEI